MCLSEWNYEYLTLFWVILTCQVENSFTFLSLFGPLSDFICKKRVPLADNLNYLLKSSTFDLVLDFFAVEVTHQWLHNVLVCTFVYTGQ